MPIRRRAARLLALLAVPLLATACGSVVRRPDVSGRALAMRAPVPDGPHCGLPRAAAADVGVPPAALDSLVAWLAPRDTDGLVVLRDGRVIAEWYSGRGARAEWLASVSKPVAALTVGTLLDDGTVRGLDQPLGDFFPEWREGARGAVTLGMLLDHTSGVAAGRGSAQLYRRADALAWARRQPLAEPPGTIYRYNNVGIFLAGEAAALPTGRPLGALARERLFEPLCIRDAEWKGDRAGHTFSAGDLAMRAVDLAKIGQLVLDSGSWRGRQVLRPATVAALTARGGRRALPSEHATNGGHGWFVFPAWDSTTVAADWPARLAAAGADSGLVATVAPYAGRRVASDPMRRAIARQLGVRMWDSLPAAWARQSRGVPLPTRDTGPAARIQHTGDGGQYLVVYPNTRLVIVRQRALTVRRGLALAVGRGKDAAPPGAVITAMDRFAAAVRAADRAREQAAGAATATRD